MVTFANGKTLETIAVYGGSMQYQDAQRKTLEIVCAVSALSLDEAKALWTDAAATSEITVAETITNPVTINTDSGDMTVSEKTETVQSVHVNFTLPVELRMDSAGLHIKLAQKSALESAGRKYAGGRNMTVENIITIISVIAAISGIIFGAAAFARNKRDDNREDGSYRSDIRYIKASMDDIKHKLDKQEQQYLDLVTRLTAVESSAKQAHHRIDRLEGNNHEN